MEHCLKTTILVFALAVAGPAHAAFTVFDIPGGGAKGGQGTYGYGLNVAGVTAGNVIDKHGATAGYVRGADGSATVFNAVPGFETHAIDIARSGELTGYYADGAGVDHGYLRAPDGTITPFDVTGAGTSAGQGTQAVVTNVHGDAAGQYVDSTNVLHGAFASWTGCDVRCRTGGRPWHLRDRAQRKAQRDGLYFRQQLCAAWLSA